MLECTTDRVLPPSLRSGPAHPPPADEVSVIDAASLSIREILDRWAIAPRKRFGQNFLHDPAVCRRIAESVDAGPGERVVEIGPGLGALTLPLLDRGAHVTAIEVDPRIADFLEERLAGHDRFTLVRGDVLAVDLAAVDPESTSLIGNLPYSITGPLLGLLIEHAGRFEQAVLMVQREVAARLVARAGGRELGAPAVLLRLLYRVERLFDIGRGAFQPPPDIVSTVLRFTRIEGAVLDPALREAVNRAYRQRRKMLRKTLKGYVAPEAALAAALVEIGQSEAARPEDLAPEDWPRMLRTATAEDRT